MRPPPSTKLLPVSSRPNCDEGAILTKNQALAHIFREIADLLDLSGENPYKARAYRTAAQAIDTLPEPIDRVAAAGALRAIPGIGPALAAKVVEWLETGEVRLHSKLKQQVPAGLLAVVALPGVGPSLARLLHQELGIDSVASLEAAARNGLLRNVKGIGPKTEANILQNLLRSRTEKPRTPLGVALPLANVLVQTLADTPGVSRVEVAGSVRRRQETVGDINLVAACADSQALMERFTPLPFVAEALEVSPNAAAVRLANGMRVDLRAVPPHTFGSIWVERTGSREHQRALMQRAQSQSGKQVPAASEAEFYASLGLPWIPPELREANGEIEAAESGRLPELITLKHIRGDLHTHTHWSDGTASIADMAATARARGYSYLAICDHSQSLRIARGLSPARLAEQMAAIRALNATWTDFQVLCGTEVDILADGRLDLPDEVLAMCDVVVASVHSGFRQAPDRLLARMEAAMRHPLVDMIGHPTGRVLGRRDPYGVDVERLVEIAAETGTALEINASPSRLDLRDLHARWAKEAGVMLCINTDAHALSELEDMAYGVDVARRAWLSPADVLNTRPLPELLPLLKRNRA